MAGTLTNHQNSGEYYRIAYKCAEVKDTQGCDGNCATCVLNVHLYVDDAREATLIKTSAALDYGKYTTTKSEAAYGQLMWNIGRALGWLLIAAFIFFGYRSCTKKEVVPPTENLPRIEVDSKFDGATLNAAWMAIGAYDYGIKDANKDGLINCIDRALQFKDHCSYSTRLIWNYNQKTGWNHLFVRVNGYDFEPMAQNYDPNERLMSAYWGKKYDPKYNKDVTAYEKQIRNGTMAWNWDLY
jgi:hypothetical protein